MKMTVLSMAFLGAAAAFAETPQVSNVHMTKIGDGSYAVTYSLSDGPAVVTLDVETRADAQDAWTSVGTRFGLATGDVSRVVSASSGFIGWFPKERFADSRRAQVRAKVVAWSLDNPPPYMVVSLNVNDSADSRWYYSSEELLPWGGALSNRAYRTTHLLMRKMLAKDVTWQMGATNQVGGQIGPNAVMSQIEGSDNAYVSLPHSVTLDANYYIMVFQMTQAQQAYVFGSGFDRWEFDGTLRPCDGQSKAYNHLRGTATGATTTPDPTGDSIIGMFRLRTGVLLDLPTEAQWEFAMKSGCGDGYWPQGTPMAISGWAQNSTNAYWSSALDRLARYSHNGGVPYSDSVENYGKAFGRDTTSLGTTNATAEVGSYPPNKWGIYDWGGNVSEWCLDFYAADITGFNGTPVLTSEAAGGTAARVVRGWGPVGTARLCTPSARRSANPAHGYYSDYGDGHGYRLAAPCTAR